MIRFKDKYYQWDINQHISNINDKYVDFLIGGEVYRLEVTDGSVRIPDEVFRTSGRKLAYICYSDGTRESFTFTVTARPIPPSYAYTETEKATFDSLTESVQSALTDLQTRVERGDFNGRDGERGEKGDRGERGERGEKGEQGERGADGASYDDTEIREEIANLENTKADKSEIPNPYDDTEIKSEIANLENTKADKSTLEKIIVEHNKVGIPKTYRNKYTIPIKEDKPFSDKSTLEKIIDIYGLTLGLKYVDLETIIKRNTAFTYTDKYYSTLSDAIADTNSSTSATGMTVKRVFVSGTGSEIFDFIFIKLINNTTIATGITVSFSSSLFIDLNGYTLNIADNASLRCENYATNDTVTSIYGMKNGSAVSAKAANVARTAIFLGSVNYFIGGEYSYKNNNTNGQQVGFIRIYSDGSTFVRPESEYRLTTLFKNIIFHNYTKMGYGAFISDNRFNKSATLIFDGCSFDLKAGDSYIVQNWIYSKTALFLNCTLKDESAKDNDDNDPSPFRFFGGFDQHIYISNCDFSAQNTIFMQATHGATIIVEQSKLSGVCHGGVYVTNSIKEREVDSSLISIRKSQKVYIQDSEINLANRSDFPANPATNGYACYIGYDADVWFNNVRFGKYDGTLGTPAVKTGGSQYKNTMAHFSNCEMLSMRCDAGCTVEYGVGISDSIKNQSISGDKTITNNSFAYEFVFEHNV